MRARLVLWAAAALLLAACGQQENFTSRAIYEPLSPLFVQAEIVVEGQLDPQNNLSDRSDVVVSFVSNQNQLATLRLEASGGRLVLAGGLPGTAFSGGERLDAESLRQVMVALGVVTAGQFKAADAEELFGLIAAAGRGPGADLPPAPRYRLLESSVTYEYQ